MARRLPVIQSSDEGEPRSPSQWVAIAAALTLTLWVPGGMLALALGRRLSTGMTGAAAAAALIIPAVASLALAAAATGAVVGRFGGRARAREAVAGSSLATLAAWGLTVSSGALAPWPVAGVTLLVLGGVAAFGAALGARMGLRRRPTLSKNG